MKNLIIPSLCLLVILLSCGNKAKNKELSENGTAEINTEVSIEEEDYDEIYKLYLDSIINSKNENYRVQIKSSPYREKIIAIDTTEFEKIFSELSKKWKDGYNAKFYEYDEHEAWGETEVKPLTAQKRALQKAFAPYKEIAKKPFLEVQGGGSYDGYSYHIVNDINGDGVKDGYVYFDYSFGTLASSYNGYALFIYKNDKFEFLQIFGNGWHTWGKETPDYNIGVFNNMIYAFSSEYMSYDPRCCPSIGIKKIYKLFDNKLIEVYRKYYSQAEER